MSRARFRQTTRLERLAAAYLRPKDNAHSGFEQSVRNYALVHTANASALILYGDPKIDEPLSFAWRRCLASAEWQKRREKYGGWDEYGRDTCGDPVVGFGATRIAKYFREYFLPDLPGADEVEKFSLIFKKAPPWLLWFTYGDANARILGIKLPDLSTAQRFNRDIRNFGMDQLPNGPFECHFRADGIEDQVAIWTKDLMIKIKNKYKDESYAVTPRERKRLRTLRDEYSKLRKPLSEQEVITKVAVVHLLSRISGVNRFEHFCIY
jgi:hypothetical protein